MKRYLNKREFLLNQFDPATKAAELNFSQAKFTEYLLTIRELKTEGDLTSQEIATIEKVKSEIKELRKKIKEEDPSKFDFDIAKIFHRNIKIERSQLNDWGFWRWLSMNYFIEEIQWRWAKKFRDSGELPKAASVIHDHLIGKSKNHRIFPRRYFTIGLRLYDKSYALLDKISDNAKNSNQGGYGDFINYIVDTKLLSHEDNVVKTMGRLLLADKSVRGKASVVRSFKKYNGFRNRMISEASEEIFRTEIIS